MDIFAQAKIRANEIAPPPVDRPIAAAATAFGFGLLVTGLFIALQWLGLPAWMAWLGSAIAYGGIAYVDCLVGWNRNTREFHDALADLKAQPAEPSLH